MLKKIAIVLVFAQLILQTNMFAQKKEYQAYIVSNAHFDTQWNWDVQKSIRDYVSKTLDQNLFLIEKYPNYIFNFEGGIKYLWMKEYYPLQYEKVKQYVKSGRWHVTGSTWDATDANVPFPESFTRNILYGQQFYQQELGVRGTDIFLPDCFGFGWTLPTIASHSGLIGFSTQKLQWRHKPFYPSGKIPFEIGLWQGIDGSRIMMVADAHNYTTKWRDEHLSESANLLKIAQSNPLKKVYHYYGTGDTGGAPDIQSVVTLEKSLKGNGPIEIISATSDQLYKDYLPFENHPELPQFSGELLMDVHGTGCYTSQAAMKNFNRKNELLADAAERAAVVADYLGGTAYPKTILSEAWKRVIWHQFHDDLTGTSIPRAYEFSWNDELISMKQFADVTNQSVASIASGLDTRVKGTPLVVYNPVARPVTDVVEVEVPAASKSLRVTGPDGKTVPSQVLYFANGKAKMLIAVKVPSCGFAVYDVTQGDANQKSSIKVNANSIDNSYYKVTLDKNGDIASILDKQNNRELVASGKSVRLALFTENESFAWPAWEILKKTVDSEPVAINGDVKISIAESGPARSAICVERKYGNSSFRQYIRLTDGGQDDRIDIYNEIDWQTTNALLKAEFPLNLNAPLAAYDLGIGHIKRGNNTETAYEVYAQRWADMYDESQQYGVSVMNDSKYGWDKPNDQTIRLTLLHTPKTRGGYAYQDKQDFGKHYFTYSIYGHKNECSEAETVHKAEVLNQGLKAFIPAKQKGALGKTFSFVSVDQPSVQLAALKQAENSDEIVLRFYETGGMKEQQVAVTLAGDIQSACEANGVEDFKSEAAFEGKTLKFNIGAFGIKTFRVKLKNREAAIAKPAFVQIPLNFNLRAASYNAFRNEANFDGKGNSYAAELWPDQISLGDIKFQLGSPEKNNGLKCKGDTIILPDGKFNKIYLLAAGARGDVKVEFMVDGKIQTAVIPYYSGFIGQWGHTGHTEGFMKQDQVAFVGTHKHNAPTNKDVPMEYTYMFPVELNIPAHAKQLILPYQTDVVIFSAVAASTNANVLPATDLMGVHLAGNVVSESAKKHRNLVVGRRMSDVSGQANRRETPEQAIDEDANTKWCDNGSAKNKYISFDLGKEEMISSWYTLHAGIESLDYITKEYSLQVRQKETEEWQTVDAVHDNTAQDTERTLTAPVKARYVRLYITKPDQSEGSIARIYEFGVY